MSAWTATLTMYCVLGLFICLFFTWPSHPACNASFLGMCFDARLIARFHHLLILSCCKVWQTVTLMPQDDHWCSLYTKCNTKMLGIFCAVLAQSVTTAFQEWDPVPSWSMTVLTATFLECILMLDTKCDISLTKMHFNVSCREYDTTNLGMMFQKCILVLDIKYDAHLQGVCFDGILKCNPNKILCKAVTMSKVVVVCLCEVWPIALLIIHQTPPFYAVSYTI